MPLRQKLIVLVLSGLLLTVSGLNSPAPADANLTSSLQLTYNQQENLRLVLSGKQLQVQNLPAQARFDSLTLILNTLHDLEAIKLTAGRDKNNCVTFSLSALPDGLYYLNLYIYRPASGDYMSYIQGHDVQLRLQSGQLTFSPAPMYQPNLRHYSTERLDIEALFYALQPTPKVQSADAGILALAASITRGLTADYDRTRAIHDWVCANLWYDEDEVLNPQPMDSSALGALQSRLGLCESYTNLTVALLRASGIPAKIVNGYALGIAGEDWPADVLSRDANHSWTEAFVNGRWITLDTTWDSGNEYWQGRKVKNDGLLGYKYFDPTLEAFSGTHLRKDAGSIPDSLGTWWTNVFTVAQMQDIWQNFFDGWVASGRGVNAEQAWQSFSGYYINGEGWPYLVQANGGTNLGETFYCQVPYPALRQAAFPFTGPILVNGQAAYPQVYTVANHTYFKLRDIAALLNNTPQRISVDWSEATGTVTINTKTAMDVSAYEYVPPGSQIKTAVLPRIKVTVNGVAVFMNAYTIEGSTYFQLRDLSAKIGFRVGYDALSGTVLLNAF
jgi:hypothetical protein